MTQVNVNREGRREDDEAAGGVAGAVGGGVLGAAVGGPVGAAGTLRHTTRPGIRSKSQGRRRIEKTDELSRLDDACARSKHPYPGGAPFILRQRPPFHFAPLMNLFHDGVPFLIVGKGAGAALEPLTPFSSNW